MNILDKLLRENRLFQARFDKLDERVRFDKKRKLIFISSYLQYQQWIADERIYFLNRIEKLEQENAQLHQLYQSYQLENSHSIRSIIDLIVQILSRQEVNTSFTILLVPEKKVYDKRHTDLITNISSSLIDTCLFHFRCYNSPFQAILFFLLLSMFSAKITSVCERESVYVCCFRERMTSEKKRRFPNLFGQCFLPCNPQVEYSSIVEENSRIFI